MNWGPTTQDPIIQDVRTAILSLPSHLSVHLQEYGLDCMHFNPQVYHDLLRCGDGSAEGLVTAFFDVVRPALQVQYRKYKQKTASLLMCICHTENLHQSPGHLPPYILCLISAAVMYFHGCRDVRRTCQKRGSSVSGMIMVSYIDWKWTKCR